MTPAERIAALDARLYSPAQDRAFLADLYAAGDILYQTDEGRTAFMDWIGGIRVDEVIQIPVTETPIPLLTRPGRVQRLLCLLALAIPLRNDYEPEWTGWRTLYQRTFDAIARRAGMPDAALLLSGLLGYHREPS